MSYQLLQTYGRINFISLFFLFFLTLLFLHFVPIKYEIRHLLDDLVFRTEPSRLQSLALQLSDKIGQLVENNERLLEQRGQVNNKYFGGGVNFCLNIFQISNQEAKYCPGAPLPDRNSLPNPGDLSSNLYFAIFLKTCF